MLQSDLPAVVDCGAPWCQPCRAIEPPLRGLAARYGITGMAALDFV